MIAALAALSMAGCGGSSNEEEIPAELVGTYTTTLERSDFPQPPPLELTDGGLRWRLTIATTGGPDDGPVLVIESERNGNLEATALEVDGNRLLLPNEECAASGSYVFYDNEYRWSLEDSTLTLTPVVNQCEDEVALTVLTSRPWTKSG